MLAFVTGENIFQSGSLKSVPGTIFLRHDILDDPVILAEALLHEATHHKLYDLYAMSSILVPRYDANAAPIIVAPWHPDQGGPESNRWTADRALAAFHVYVHLTLMFEALAEVAGGTARAVVARSRAEYLGSELAALDQAFGTDGSDLVNWLLALLRRARHSNAPHQEVSA